MTILESLQTLIGIISAVLIIVGLLYWAPLVLVLILFFGIGKVWWDSMVIGGTDLGPNGRPKNWKQKHNG